MQAIEDCKPVSDFILEQAQSLLALEAPSLAYSPMHPHALNLSFLVSSYIEKQHNQAPSWSSWKPEVCILLSESQDFEESCAVASTKF